jgi:hypothetical protein
MMVERVQIVVLLVVEVLVLLVDLQLLILLPLNVQDMVVLVSNFLQHLEILHKLLVIPAQDQQVIGLLVVVVVVQIKVVYQVILELVLVEHGMDLQ